MRKLVVAVTAMFVLSVAAYAYAQAAPQQNTYEVTASTKPTRAGSSARPVPLGLKFGFTVSEAQGRRPAVIKKYSIRFGGLRVNSSVAGVCRKSVLEARGPSACPARSIVGTGFIENSTGNRDDPNDQSIPCNAGLTIVSHGNRRASIFVQGDPQQEDPRRRCAIALNSAIPARFVNRAGENSLDFEVPDSLTHPLASLSNAVKKVTSSIKLMRKNGKGFFESRGGCTAGRRRVRALFTPEGATQAVTESIRVACRR